MGGQVKMTKAPLTTEAFENAGANFCPADSDDRLGSRFWFSSWVTAEWAAMLSWILAHRDQWPPNWDDHDKVVAERLPKILDHFSPQVAHARARAEERHFEVVLRDAQAMLF